MTKFNFDLANRTALVTGAGQGVGREIARTLASHGAHVAVNDFVSERAGAVAAEIQDAGGRAEGVQADVSDPGSVLTMMMQIERKFGPIDILVNNAGNAGPDQAITRTEFWKSEPEDWDRYMGVNLRGVMLCARACCPAMVERRHGRIISIVSEAGRTGEKGFEAYSAAKAGASGFSRALARSLGIHGITVNTISLSNIRREGVEYSPETEARFKEMLKQYIVRRQGTPTDVALMALVLASEESAWITGQNYPVNGGFALAI